MLDEPGGRWLFPDPDEFVEVNEQIFISTMGRAMDEGRVDAWGDPFVGVAVWLEQPVIGEESPRRQPSSVSSPILPEHAAARVGEFARLLQRMRRLARPDHHVYLDTIGVLPDHRSRGVATGLLRAGFTWADNLGLPCSLDTLDPDNAAFYRRRGFDAVASELLTGSDLTLTSMRRSPHA
jgi:GNAT superfamily N-acetyltransferase